MTRAVLPLLATSLLLSLLLALGCNQGAKAPEPAPKAQGTPAPEATPEPTPPPTEGDTGTPADPTPAPTGVADFEPAKFFADNCSRCHGAQGEGKEGSGPAYATRMDKPVEAWAATIREGTKNGMPRFQVLSEEQALAMATWIRETLVKPPA